jgi:hypothetical protein
MIGTNRGPAMSRIRLMRLSFIFVLFFSSIAAAPCSQLNKPRSTATQDLLDDLGGFPCFDGSLFTCVTIEMPLEVRSKIRAHWREHQYHW